MKRRISVAILVFILLLLNLTASAQGTDGFSQIQIDIWPEFDKPAALVIYRIVLPAESVLPAEIAIRIPSSAGVPNAVAARQPDGSLLNLTYEQEPAGDWSTIQFLTNSTELQVEYYDPDIVVDGKNRHFEYLWPGDHRVESMVIQVQQPFGVSEIQFSPSFGSGVQGNDGLIYYTSSVGALEAGQTFNIVMDYVKEVEGLTLTALEIESSAPIEPTLPSRLTLQDVLPAFLAILGFALLVGGIIWYWQTGKNGSRKRNNKTTRGRRGSAGNNQGEAGGYIYCHQCGKRAQTRDRFCRVCGTSLRVNNS